jgi:predicted house-cleaning noncanonical NTP pyrophosphatase (MazG superfamily)
MQNIKCQKRGGSMIYKYNKLVRDKIPEEIENQGKECKYEILDDEKYSKELDKKLLEEVNEYISDHSEKEMADVQEVLKAIIKYRNIDEKRVEELRKAKELKKGGFYNKIYLTEVLEGKNEKQEQNKINTQEGLLTNIDKSSTLDELQEYIRSVIRIRGFEKQEIEKTMLLLLEETGELAKAIRKDYTDMGIDDKKLNHYTNIENEVADVFIVLICICNKLNINLFDAVYKKEAENVTRNWDKKENKNG